MATGTVILAATLAFGFSGARSDALRRGDDRLGPRLNFLHVGGTVLLGQAHRPAERFRAQAINDFSVFGTSTAGSLGAGLTMHLFGWHGVLTAAAVPIGAAIAVLAAVRPDRRMAQD